MEETSFIIEWGTYCYQVMPFGLKNAGVIYQRVTTTICHDMIVKSRDRADHLAVLDRFFERIRQFRFETKCQEVHFWNDFWETTGIHGQ